MPKLQDFGKEFDLDNLEDLEELNALIDKRLERISVFALQNPQYFTENGLRMAREYVKSGGAVKEVLARIIEEKI